jgi:hypothetical protein
MIVRPAQSRTREQAAYLDQLIQSNETIAALFKLAQDFSRLLRKREGQVRLEQWKASVGASGISFASTPCPAASCFQSNISLRENTGGLTLCRYFARSGLASPSCRVGTQLLALMVRPQPPRTRE